MRVALNHLCPHNTSTGLEKTRLGPVGDGGYVVVKDFVGVDTLVSFGVGHNIDFEHQMLSQGIQKVVLYDGSVDQLPNPHARFNFHKKFIGAQTANNTITLADVLKQNGLETNHNLFLKCDIEDAELEMIETTTEHVFGQFTQIVMEYHYFEQMTNQERYSRVSNCWEKLSRTHKVVHVHGNTCGPLQIVNGILLPQCLEVTYLRNDRAHLSPYWGIFPTPIDVSNIPYNEDYFLGSFRFL